MAAEIAAGVLAIIYRNQVLSHRISLGFEY